MKIGCNGTGGVKFSCTIPSGTIGLGLIGTGGAVFPAYTESIDASATLTTFVFCPVSSTKGVLHFKGTIEIGGSGGTVQINFASGTNTQTSTVYKLGTFLIAIEK